MPANQDDRYNIAARTTDLRNVVFELILVTTVLGLGLNLIADVVFTTVNEFRLPLFWRVLIVVLLVAVGVVALLWFWRRNDRVTTDEARIDLLVPYELNPREGLFIPALMPQAPYSVISEAHEFFDHAFSKEERLALRRRYLDWQAGQSQAQLRDWAIDYHHQMIDALLLEAIDFFNERSLGRHARVGWMRSPLPSEQRELGAFPQRLQDNPFIQAKRGWKIRMPVAVSLTIDELADGWVWTLSHKDHGAVRLHISRKVGIQRWEGRPSAKIRTLRTGLPLPAADATCLALGSRISASADVRGILGRRRDEADCFCNWATRLLTVLEQSLDWEYFNDERFPRQKLIWTSEVVDDLQERLARLEALLETPFSPTDGTDDDHA